MQHNHCAISSLRRSAREVRLRLRLRRRWHVCLRNAATCFADSRDILFRRDSQSHGALAGGAAEGGIGKAVIAVIAAADAAGKANSARPKQKLFLRRRMDSIKKLDFFPKPVSSSASPQRPRSQPAASPMIASARICRGRRSSVATRHQTPAELIFKIFSSHISFISV
jgi:hypothetical protein